MTTLRVTVAHVRYDASYRPVLFKLRPAGQMRPAKGSSPARGILSESTKKFETKKIVERAKKNEGFAIFEALKEPNK